MRLALLVFGITLAAAAGAQTPVAALGKQRAAASTLPWEVREAGHPALGPIVFGVLKTPVSTPVGNNRVWSNVYVSCERSAAKIAIELTNGTRPDDPGGLKPKTMPRLTCNTLGVSDGKPTAEPLAARWTVNGLGDAMARGLWPSALRDCASIGIAEELVLPAGWERESARVEFEITPYARELDAVFARCGEPTAYPAEVAKAPSALPPAPAASAALNAWTSARVVADGRTNVRARPDTHAALVIRLDPGDVVLVQRAEGDWWKAKSRPSAKVPFEGYIRSDRLVPR